MALTLAQKTTLKNDIATNFPGVANDNPGNDSLVAAYNANAAPDFTVWKSAVSIGDVGKTFNATELAGLTSLNTQRLQNLAAWLAAGVNPSLSTVRQFFDDIFSGAGGNNTRPALLALWKRLATRAEKLYATGTGSSGSPATLTFEGLLSRTDIEEARNS